MALLRCPECGKEISSEAKNCMHCGLPITEKKLETARHLALYYQMEQQEKQSRIKWGVIIISAVVLCVGVALIKICIEKYQREEAERIHSEAEQAHSEFVEMQRENSEIERILSELEDMYS